MKRFFIGFAFLACLGACGDDEGTTPGLPEEEITSFSRVAEVNIGEEGAAEIAAYDKEHTRLFVVNNASDSRIDVLDFNTPAAPVLTTSLDMSSYGGGVNSIAVSEDYLAVAVEAENATANGSVVIFDLEDLREEAEITAGPLPDMVTFSPDGEFILVANEGEPSDDYLTDPDGSISIIETGDFSIVTLDFSAFNGQESALEAAGYRVTGPGADLAADTEPEYITVSPDSRTAYVALQENNGLAIVDLENKSISSVKALGLKDYAAEGHRIDPSDDDNAVNTREVPAGIKGVYMPDAIEAFEVGGRVYLVTANEGDAREYFYDTDEATCTLRGQDFDEDDGCLAFTDEDRIKDVELDPTAFPNAEAMQEKSAFGRLKLMLTNGDTDGDGDYDEIYTYGSRSFTIWDAQGNLVADVGEDLEQQVIAAGLYPDNRSDDKGVEPEGVAIGKVSGKTLVFVGLERADALAVYDVTVPADPQFVKILQTGDAPEGIVFIPAADSPTQRSILVVSCEGDGTVWVYSTQDTI